MFPIEPKGGLARLTHIRRNGAARGFVQVSVSVHAVGPLGYLRRISVHGDPKFTKILRWNRQIECKSVLGIF